MKPDTLKQLRNINITRHNVSAVNKQLNADAQKAIDFMETLVKKGIPLEQINTTDWNSAPIKVFVTVPYGKKGGGKRKEFKRFSDREVASAMKFWKDPKCEGGLLMKNAGKVSPRSKGKKDVGDTEGALKDIKSIERYVNFSIKGNAHQFQDSDPDFNRMMNDHSVYLSDKEFLEKYKDKFGRSFDDDEFEENGNMEEFYATEEYYITFKDDSEITVSWGIPNGNFISADVREEGEKKSLADKWIGEFNKKGWNMDIDELHQKSKANSKWSGGEASPRANRQQMIKGGSADLLNKIKTEGKISEKDINLIKNRMNNDKMDAETTELVQWIWDNTPELTDDQNKKGLDFLMNQWKSPRGKERTNHPFGYREQGALETFKSFELAGFYDTSMYGGRKFYVPLYNVIGDTNNFQYYYNNGKVNIVGAQGGKMKDAGEVSPRKARRILHDKKVHGKSLSEAQRGFFGARASGYPVKKADAGKAGDKYDARFTKVKGLSKSTDSFKQKPIIIGLTQDDNIFWVETSNNINPWGSEPQPDRGFTMSGSTSDIYSMDGAKKYAKEYWKDFFEQDPDQLRDMNERMGTKFRSATAGAKYVLDTDGELHGFDNDTKLGEVEYKGKTYIFHSQSGGQITDTMEEDVLKKIYVDKQTFETLKRLWSKFHGKQLPSKEGIPLIEQDKDAILQDAIKTTGKKYCGGGDVEMNEGGKIKTIADLKEKNKELGHHFFSPETMRFFGSKIESGILGGNYFITSEKNFDDTKREFRVRSFAPTGKIGNPLGKTFDTKEQAKDAIKEHTKKLLHGGKSSSAPAYAKAGKAGANMDYDKRILPVLKEAVQNAWKPIAKKYHLYDETQSEIENRSGEGFIAFTDGGYKIHAFNPLTEFDGTGLKMPTEKSQKQIDKWIKECYDDTLKGHDEESEEFQDAYQDCLGGIAVDFDLRAIYYAPDNARSEFKGKPSVYVVGIINDDLKDRKDLIEEGFSFETASELNSKLESAMNKVLAWFKVDGNTKNSGGKSNSGSTYKNAGKAGKENPYYVKPISGKTRKLFLDNGLSVFKNTSNGLLVAEKLKDGHATAMYGLYTQEAEEVAPPKYQYIDQEVNANGMTRVTHADGSSGAIEAFVSEEMGKAGKAGDRIPNGTTVYYKGENHYVENGVRNYDKEYVYKITSYITGKSVNVLRDEVTVAKGRRLARTKKLNGGTDFESGATSAEVDNLILHADNDARLAGERDGIYQMAVNGNWNSARLHQQFKRIFSYMTETSYNKEVPSEKIQLNEEQRNEFAQLYTDGFTNWKKDKGISKQNAGEAGDNGSNTDTMENVNNNNGQENGLTNGEENGDNGNGTEEEPETPEVPEIPEPATPEIADSTAKLRQAVETLKSAEEHSHTTDGAIESATRNVQEAVEELETPQLGNGGSSKKVSPDKQKLKEKIEKIEDALDSEKTSAQSRERLSKELATLRTQYERRVPVAERLAMSKGKFYIEMPLEYRETMNGLLWGKNIRPHYTALGDSLRISVDSKPRLSKVYSIYSNMLKKKDLPVPSLESISGKPAKVRRRR